ncbi:MAG: VWA domain-containing protein [Fimbriimonadaceae bacterium]|nr:VWA domain-containing protein [Fimbriimonadaceae bacterium]
MSFVSASALAWLAPILGAILALYLLKMRRRDFVVPATFLWPARTFEVRANSLFQRLRLSLLLFLQLLAAALVIFAMARPQVRQRTLAGELTVVVVDASASMGAREGGSTRFDLAVQVCRSLVDSVRAGDRMSVVEAGPSPRVVIPVSSDAGKMRQALQTLRPTDAAGDLGEALRLAASIAAPHKGARIVLLSDGVFPPIADFSPGNARFEFVPIGTQMENVGISAFSIAPAAKGVLAFCGVRNYGKKPIEATLDLLADGKLFNSKRIALDGGASFGQTFSAPSGATVLEARIQPDDALAADNRAFALADPGARVRALLVGRGDLFLERALALDPRVTLDRAAALPPEAGGEAPYDLVVFDGVPEQPTRARGVLTFGAAGPSSPVRRVGVAKSPRVRSQQTEDPVMEAVDLLDTYIETAERVEPKPEGRVLAEGSQGPLIVAADGAQRKLYVAFLPVDSDLPLQVAFPIFVANALDFLAPRESGGDTLLMPPGRTFALPASGEGALSLKGPDGASATLAATNGAYTVREAVRSGVYEFEQGGKKRTLLVGTPPESESEIAPRAQVFAGGSEVAGSESLLRLADLWRWVVLAGLIVLAVEWWVFARRS